VEALPAGESPKTIVEIQMNTITVAVIHPPETQEQQRELKLPNLPPTNDNYESFSQELLWWSDPHPWSVLKLYG
jgi:hypothetical protein